MENISEQFLKKEMETLPGWQLEDNELVYQFEGRSFIEVWVLMSQIAFKSEEMNHHPDWRNIYNKLTIRLKTHDSDGITSLDLELARFISTRVKELFNR